MVNTDVCIHSVVANIIPDPDGHLLVLCKMGAGANETTHPSHTLRNRQIWEDIISSGGYLLARDRQVILYREMRAFSQPTRA